MPDCCFSSSLILRVLCDAHKSGQTFRVVVIDSRPKLEGQCLHRPTHVQEYVYLIKIVLDVYISLTWVQQ